LGLPDSRARFFKSFYFISFTFLEASTFFSDYFPAASAEVFSASFSGDLDGDYDSTAYEAASSSFDVSVSSLDKSSAETIASAIAYSFNCCS